MKVQYTQQLVDELAELDIDFFDETYRAIYNSVSEDIQIDFVEIKSENLKV